MSGVTGAIIGTVVGAGASIYAGRQAAGATRDAANTATDAQERMYETTRADFAPQRQLGYDAISAINRLYGYRGQPTADSRGFNEGNAPGTQRMFPTSGAFDPRGTGFSGGLQTGSGPIGSAIGRAVGPVTIDGETGQPLASGSETGQSDLSGFFESPDYQFNLGQGQQAIDRSAAARGGLLSGRAVKEGTRFASGLASREYSSFVDRLFQQAGIGSTGIGATASAGANAANNISAAAINAGNARASAYGNAAAGVNNSIQGGIGNYMLMRYLNKGGIPLYGDGIND